MSYYNISNYFFTNTNKTLPNNYDNYTNLKYHRRQTVTKRN